MWKQQLDSWNVVSFLGQTIFHIFHTKAAVLWSDGDLFLGLPLSYSIMCFVPISHEGRVCKGITLLLSIDILSIIIVRLVCFLLLNSSVSSEPKRKRKRSSECSETLTTNGISSLRLGSLKSEPGTWKQLAVNFLVYKCNWYFCFQMNNVLLSDYLGNP